MGKIFSTILLAVIIPLLPLLKIEWNIVTSSLSSYSICEIQGSDFYSPIEGEQVETQGIVFGDADDTWRKGFFMQNEECDGDPKTSDGLFVYLGTKEDVVSPGDLVKVSGIVQEYRNLTEILTTPMSVTVQSTNNPIPAAVSLDPPFDNTDAELYFETLEGMHVQLTDAIVVGPTDYDDRTWVIRSDLEMDRVFFDDLRGTGEVIWVDDLGLFRIHPDVEVGDRILNLSGAIDYFFDEYSMFLLKEPQVVINSLASNSGINHLTSYDENHFSISTFNLWNMFDSYDDLDTEDTPLTEPEYQRRLQKRALAITNDLNEPNIIAIQEVEKIDVLMELVSQPEFSIDYDSILLEGPDRRGLDSALLYEPGKVEIIAFEQKQGCTDLIDGLGPDGNHDLQNPENDIVCDTDGDEIEDGNRLFSRPPLAVRARICLQNCVGDTGNNWINNYEMVDVWIIVNHWKSKYEDTESIKYTLPRRVRQSQFIADLVHEIIHSDPEANVIVIGDLNDTIDSTPLQILEDGGLVNLMRNVYWEERYTYIYQGVSQTLDHILVRIDQEVLPVVITPKHINSDFPYSYYRVNDSSIRSSDHDPVNVLFGYFSYSLHVPLVMSVD